ncbi:AAA family ATPase [Deinococcus aquiradiocola]|uniref:AAA+ ATPase domain-containing protein n=1 Tax=Deinococcus aquiradiocola TaxID=393059 RepID=A0A917PN48_9DEIO|nr:AAA family ATPase [Deinococcus aquiradiocola]GGJ85730.1 hypothetical protein GCM10008939_32010 [Deinococcus aquiradiocola]
MLTVHLLGHAHVTQNGQPVPLSAKAVALIAYLAAEKLPQHRERLADLLWNTAEARTNLRVELARIRSAGLNIFPASRQLLYLESIGTDIGTWQAAQEQEMTQTELSTWLSTLRGLPLCGLEDLGSTAFQVWVEQQRWMLCEQVESTLARVYAHYARSGQEWATRLISSRAEAVGFTDPAELLTETLISEARPLVRAVPDHAVPGGTAPVLAAHAPQAQPSMVRPAQRPVAGRPDTPARPAAGTAPATPLHFTRPAEESALRDLFMAGGAAFVLLHGPPGSGKTYLAERLAQSAAPDWQVVHLAAARSGRLLLAALAQALLRLAGPDQSAILRQVLLQPGALEEDMVKVAVALAQIERPLLLLIEEVHAAPAELPALLELVRQMPSDTARLYLLLSREEPDRQPVTRTLMRRLPGVRSVHLPPVTLGAVQAALHERYPEEEAQRLQPLASRLVQRSEGNPLHLLSLFKALPDTGTLGAADLGGVDLGSTTLPQAVRDTLRSEPEGWSDDLRDAMSRLSVINGTFDRRTARAVLGISEQREVDRVLCDALERQILLETDPGLGLHLPYLTPVRVAPDTGTQYMFRQEALRVTLAGQLPQLIRQDVRRRLALVLADHEPGLASYYADRAGLTEQAAELLARHNARLPHDSPLRRTVSKTARPALRTVSEPPRLAVPEQQARSHQGYTVALEDGWLNVMSDGRYGHPQTLTLTLTWTEALTAPLRLIWRLDVFGRGEELLPSQAAFALRLTPIHTSPAHASAATVLSPGVTHPYQEDGLRCTPQDGVDLGHWMEHQLTGPEWLGATGARLSVRALDVALSIGLIGSEDRNLMTQPAVLNRNLKAPSTRQTG